MGNLYKKTNQDNFNDFNINNLYGHININLLSFANDGLGAVP